MARYGKSPFICPFCGSPEKDHEPRSGSGGWAIHWACKTCGAMGPRVRVPENKAWLARCAFTGEKSYWDTSGYQGYAIKARELFYGVSQPVLSGRVPPME